jgi:predicted RNA methylase
LIKLKKTELKERLFQYSTDILNPENFHDKLAPAVMGYADLLFEEFDLDNSGGREHIQTLNGNAIGTFWAAKCIREIFRTQRFSRALYSSVLEAIDQSGKQIHVLYAGTGPFAALALPIMMMLKPEDVQFTFLEINHESIEILEQVIDLFDLRAYVKNIHQCDASLWDVPSSGIDIVISETMSRALIAEPQVAIILNLASQLPKEVVFLPEEIKVSLCKLSRGSKEPEKIAELINFNKSSMYSIIENSSMRNWNFIDQNIQTNVSEGDHLYFMTEIRINEGNDLNLNDSSLNLLEKLKVNKKQGLINLNFKYALDKRPGFRVIEK